MRNKDAYLRLCRCTGCSAPLLASCGTDRVVGPLGSFYGSLVIGVYSGSTPSTFHKWGISYLNLCTSPYPSILMKGPD